jgi:hypothetical protein
VGHTHTHTHTHQLTRERASVCMLAKTRATRHPLAAQNININIKIRLFQEFHSEKQSSKRGCLYLKCPAHVDSHRTSPPIHVTVSHSDGTYSRAPPRCRVWTTLPTRTNKGWRPWQVGPAKLLPLHCFAHKHARADGHDALQGLERPIHANIEIALFEYMVGE